MLKLSWLKNDQRKVLRRGYLEKGETPEERYQTICDTVQKYSSKITPLDTSKMFGYTTIGIKERFEEYFTNNWVSLATPVLSSFGRKYNLPISCNHSILEDSLDNIYKGLHEIGMLAKHGAGTAVNFSDLRPIGSKISTGGKSNSIMDFIELYADMMSKTAQNCYKDDVEVLTTEGWQLFKNLTPTSYVASVLDNDSIEFVIPTEHFKYDFEGDLINFKDSKNVDISVTDNHNMVFKRRNRVSGTKSIEGKYISNVKEIKNEFYLKEAKDVPTHREIFMYKASMKTGNSVLTFKEKLLIAYQADGSISSKNCIRFHFSKQRKIRELRSILNKLDYKFSETITKEGTTKFHVNCREEFSKYFNWIDLNIIDSNWGKEFLLEISKWDSSTINNSYNSFQYFSVEETNINTVQAICALTGYSSTKTVSTPTNNIQPLFALYISEKRHFGLEKMKPTKEYYKGSVYCVEVPSNKLIVRSNGRTLICGNSQRRGFLTAYLSLDHPEIMDFLDIGTEAIPVEKQRFFQTITTGVIIPDGWREELKNGDRAKRKIFQKVLNTRKEIGYPYILDEENSNKGICQAYIDKGMKIKGSNICVTPDTKILTDKGYIEIGTLVNKTIKVWNGEEFSKTVVKKTGENQPILKITVDSGQSIKNTYQHHYYKMVEESNKKYIRVAAEDLVIGDRLIKFNLPVIEGVKELSYSYTQGFYSGDGTCNKEGKALISLYDKKMLLVDKISVRNKFTQKGLASKETNIKAVYYRKEGNRIDCTLPKDINKNKLFIPNTIYSIESRLKWLAGLLDADGCIDKNKKAQGIQLVSVNKDFLLELQLMLQTLGCNSSIKSFKEEGNKLLPKNDGSGELAEFLCKKTYRMLISPTYVTHLYKIGLTTYRLIYNSIPLNRNSEHFIKIKKITKDKNSDTFCFTEPKRNMGMFNGILTGQCIEAMEYCDYEKTFACCLSAVNLYYFDDFKDHPYFIKDMNILLDCVIEEYIEKGSKLSGLEKAVKFAKEHRAIGLGTTAFHSYLQKNSIAFDSLQSYQANFKIFSLLRKESDEASKWMAANWGEPKILKGYGERNTSRMAQAPKKSTTFIDGGIHLALSEGIEPHKFNYGEKKVAKIQVEFKNRELEQTLIKYDKNTEEIWDSMLDNNGSIQHLNFLSDHEKEVFKTFSEISQAAVIKLAGQRQQFIDMGQSINIMIHPDTSAKDIIKLHLMAFDEGLKSLYYQNSINASQMLATSLLECSACEG